MRIRRWAGAWVEGGPGRQLYWQGAAAAMENCALAGLQPAPMAQGQQGGEGGVATEPHLAAGGEPAQQPLVPLPEQKSGF